MAKFLQKIADELLQDKKYHLKTIVLPTKRSAVFLKKSLIDRQQKPLIAPQIITIQDFFVNNAPWQLIDELNLWFEFYQIYQEYYQEKAQSFDEFINWAPSILQDFNEIDYFLINPKEVFTYINEVKKIEDWTLKPQSPQLITDYLKFFASLNDLYQKLIESLTQKHLASSGMIYRYVAENIDKISAKIKPHSLIFAGYNALTKSEEKVILHLINEQKAKIYWDADTYYLKKEFEAGMFLRKHIRKFPDFKWIENNFEESKQIDIIGVNGNTTQTQAVAQILKEQKESLLETAVVLNDENLLIPLINSLPQNISSVNISLGFPLKQLPVYQLFELILNIYQSQYKYEKIDLNKILEFVQHNYFVQILPENENEELQNLIQVLKKFKTKYINHEIWLEKLSHSNSFVKQLFPKNINNIPEVLNVFFNLINYLSDKKLSRLDQLALVRIEKIFKYLENFIKKTRTIKNINTFQVILNRLIHRERLAFEGEPLKGLQIIGMLETRLLDFNHIIVLSMNEGIIPKGKNDRSIIPFELKKHFALPMHTEQTAVTAYHFYRLLQRAKKITLLYNMETNGITSGEQSRFITQLENELDKKIHHINKKQLSLSTDLLPQKEQSIEKDEFILKQLNQIALQGFSPSSLTSYIRNPLIFYQEKILKLEKIDLLSDNLPSNIMGNIIHEVMELLYRKHIGRVLKVNDLNEMFKIYPQLALEKFIEHTFGEETPVDKKLIEGKNLIIFEIIKKNIKDILTFDKKTVQKHRLEIVALEQKYKTKLPVDEKTIYLKGFIDRIDRLDGQLRIIDYKTGSVENSNVSTNDFEKINTDKKTEKLFQLLTYAYLYYRSGNISTGDLPLQVGIISTRKMKTGLFSATINGNKNIDIEILKKFEKKLIDLINEIFNPEIPFIETDSKY